MQQKLSLAILCILALLFFIIAPSTAQASAYQDVDNHPAAKAIYRISALDLMAGYPGNIFKPNQTISQLESMVVLMKAGGYTKDLPKTAPSTFWGQKFIDKAYQEQLITQAEALDLIKESPATRLKIAIMLSRMLHLPQTEIDLCPDIVTLSSTEQQAISGVLANGLMSKSTDGNFRPGQPVTRAETAVIVSNLIDKNWIKLPAEQRLTGWISAINIKGNNKEIELTSLSGIKRLRLDPQVTCFINNALFSPNHLLNTRVEVLLNSKKQVDYLSYIEGFPSNIAQLSAITGSIKTINLGMDNKLILSNLDCEEVVLPLSDFAVLKDLKDATPGSNLLALKPNTFVELTMYQGKVLQVQTLKTFTASGTVLRFDDHRMYLSAQGSGKNRPEWFNYYDRARVVDSKGVKAAKVTRGDKVKVTYLDPDPEGIDDELPLEITVTSRTTNRKVSGVVQSVSLSGSSPHLVLNKNKTYLIDTSLINSLPSIANGAKIEFMIDGAAVIVQVLQVTPPTS